jgi:hypothetical protein
MGTKTGIKDLREHLFGVLEDLGDPESKVDLERVKQITEVSKQILDAAKTEIEMVKVLDAAGVRIQAAPEFFGGLRIEGPK